MSEMWASIPLPTRCRVLDLGCMDVSQEPEFYTPLLAFLELEIVGIDALPEAFALGVTEPRSRTVSLPLAVGDGSKQTLHVCSLPSCSSLFPPNTWLCSQFAEISQYVDVTEARPLQTHRLDDIEEIGDVDWIKMDLQGGELGALNGGRSTFQKAVAVQTEVRFLPQYLQQPLFAEVDQALRRLGFDFHCFLGYGSRPLKPVIREREPRRGFKQWLWADAVYIPSIRLLENLLPDKLLRLALILHAAYESYDFAYRALSLFDTAQGTNYASQYFQQLESEFDL